MKLRVFAALAAALSLAALTARTVSADSAGASPRTIDAFDYADSASVAAAWVAQAGSPPPRVAESGPWGTGRLTVFPCDFEDSSRDRCYWDRDITLDLSRYATFALRVYCELPAPIESFTLYFRSGEGWYGASAQLSSAGWNTLVFDREQFSPEDSPAGWDRVDGIRLSPWRASKQNTTLYADRLWAYTPAILVVRPTKTAAEYGDDVDPYCQPFLDWMGLYGLPVSEVSDEGVEAGLLGGASLAILPYNPVTSAIEVQQIASFVRGGGKLFLCYEVDPALTDLLGVRQVRWNGTDVCAMSFRQSTLPGLPARARQASWNFMQATPSRAGTRVVASWEDCDGKVLNYAALLSSPAGAYLTHVLLNDDPVLKQQMLLALTCYLVPSLKGTIARSALDHMGQVALYTSFAEATSDIGAKGPASLHPEEVAADIKKAAADWTTAKSAYASGAYAQVLTPAFDGRTWLTTAYVLCQRPKSGELRATWAEGTGPWPGEWTRAVDQLAKNGFNAVLPNMLWGGLADYPSKYLPRSDTYRKYGDQMAQCLAACRASGLQMYVWKIDWNLESAPQWFVDKMKSQKRTQVDVYGNDVRWLCPSNPLNRQLESDSLMEVVANYGVDGIHFDYIRYPDETTCYCTGCRTRFEAYRGSPVAHWPGDCYNGPLRSEYRDWRCLQITTLVHEVHDRAKALKPDIKISAAVFSDYPDCRTSVGQDWIDWIRKGYLDFVCPMDYTTSANAFSKTVATQIRQVNGAIPMYPGIGASLGLPIDQLIVQILETRRQGTAGFTLFEFDKDLAGGTLDLLGTGTTHPWTLTP